MKLLIITQKVDINDDVLGFFHSWILEFVKHCDKVTVICLEKGNYELPENIKILSLGKENTNFQFSIFNFQSISNLKIFKKITYLWNFYKYIWQERINYDCVFVHMNPEYIVLGGIFWKLWCKKISLWYVHKAVNIKLRLAEKMADVIFTASKLSFRMHSKKVEIVGHGIDVNKFSIFNFQFLNNNEDDLLNKIITVGRISPTKDYESMIKAVDILNMDGKGDITLSIIGNVGMASQNSYLQSLKEMVKIMNLENKVDFLGSIPNSKIPEYLQNADIFINMSGTGSVDKAILEAMACGCIPITSNEAFSEILPAELLTEMDNPKKLAEKIKWILALSVEEKAELSKKLRDIIEKNYDLKKLIGIFIKLLSS